MWFTHTYYNTHNNSKYLAADNKTKILELVTTADLSLPIRAASITNGRVCRCQFYRKKGFFMVVFRISHKKRNVYQRYKSHIPGTMATY